jgi:hypothetical protein
MVGQVDETFEEGSIKQHQTDQIYKAYWKTWHLGKFKNESEDDCYIYEIFLESNTSHYVKFGQVNDIIGGEEWLQGEVNCLCNIASS